MKYIYPPKKRIPISKWSSGMANIFRIKSSGAPVINGWLVTFSNNFCFLIFAPSATYFYKKRQFQHSENKRIKAHILFKELTKIIWNTSWSSNSCPNVYSAPSVVYGVLEEQYGQPNLGFPPDFPAKIITNNKKNHNLHWLTLGHVLTHFDICCNSEFKHLYVYLVQNTFNIEIIFGHPWNGGNEQEFFYPRIPSLSGCNTL